MGRLIICFIIQLFLLLLLLKQDANDGEKELFQNQQWKNFDIILTMLSVDSVYFLYFLNFKYNLLKALPVDLLYLVLLLLIFFLFKYRFRQSISSLGFRLINSRNIIIASLFVAVGNFVILYTLYFLMGKPQNYAYHLIKEIELLRNGFDWIKFIFFSIVVAPVVEEILYRGVLYSPYRKKYGPTIAIIITSIFFTVSHFGLGILSNFIGGILLAILYEKTNTLVSPIIAHIAYNL